MSETDRVRESGVGPRDANPNLRMIGWLVEKVGLPGAIILAMMFYGGKKLDDIGAKIDRIAAVMEAKK